jgi:homocysteine S-methyltransferase
MSPLTARPFPPVLVIDGGLATELERRGLDLSGPLWSARALLDQPAIVEDVHAAYLVAGADCLITASYQISFEGFARAGLSAAETVQALDQSTAVAAAARRRYAEQSHRPVWIAASLGPFGATLHDGSEYHGRYDLSFDDLVGVHRSRLEHLQRGPIDLVACETVPSLEEARAMLRALAAFPSLRAWLSFTCADGRSTGAGDDIAECARLAEHSAQIAAVGVNCTSPLHVDALIDRMRPQTGKPIVVYPNSGERWDAAGRRWTGRSEADEYGTLALSWYRRGARWIGGCCRTSPAHIAEVRAALNAAGVLDTASGA